jgi:DNA-directed RNA polymerase subunit beta'
VAPGARLAEWDPFAVPIVSEFAGRVRYADLKEGQSLDERTMTSRS